MLKMLWVGDAIRPSFQTVKVSRYYYAGFFSLEEVSRRAIIPACDCCSH